MANIPNFTVKKTVECNLDAQQWELYTASMDCSKAVKTLNLEFEKAVNSGKTRREVYGHMYYVMDHLAEYGAADTEAFYTLDDLISEVFD